MKNITKAQATLKIREAMSGLREAHRTASPAERKVIHACMNELRQIQSDLSEEDTVPSTPVAAEDEDDDDDKDDEALGYEDDVPVTPSADADTDLAMDDEPIDGDDDLDDDLTEDVSDDENMDEMGEDEELALSALELAAHALKAAGEEAADDADKPVDDDVAAEDEDDDSDDDSDDSDDDSDADSDDDSDDSDDDSDPDADDSDDDLGGDDDAVAEEPEADDMADKPADDMAAEDEEGAGADDDGDGEDDDSEEILSEDELKALEDEGLVDASAAKAASIGKRLSTVRARLAKMAANVGEAGDVLDPTGAPASTAPAGANDALDEMPAGYEEDAEETLSTAEYHDLMASLAPEERRELRRSDVLGKVSAAKMSRTAFHKMKKTALKNRKKRKFRTAVKKSQKGKKASVTLPGGKRKDIKKHFFFSTYDAKGKFLGTFWIAAQKVNKETAAAYLKKYGVKHPGMLPKVDPEQKWKKKPAAKKPGI